jgi:hypothetical protein
MLEEFDVRIGPTACRQISCCSHEHAPSDYVYLIEVPSDRTPVLREGAAFAWMALEDIEKLPLGFGQRQILKHIPSRPPRTSDRQQLRTITITE